MSKAGEKIIAGLQSGIGNIHFLNIFTGKTEPFRTSEQANASMFVAAAARIDELEKQIAEIKAFLVID